MSRYADIQENASFSQLEPVPADAVKRMRAEYPGLPHDYTEFLLAVGAGEAGGGAFMLYGGLISPEFVYDAESAKRLDGLWLIGDDFQGYCVAFSPQQSWAVVEIDPTDKSIEILAPSFIEFVRGRLCVQDEDDRLLDAIKKAEDEGDEVALLRACWALGELNYLHDFPEDAKPLLSRVVGLANRREGDLCDDEREMASKMLREIEAADGLHRSVVARMRIEHDSVQPAPSVERLSVFEASYRVVLPPDYRAYLAGHNGAAPVGGAAFSLGNNERVVERFLALLDAPRDCGDAGWYDVSVVLTQIDDRLIEDEDLVGTNMVPIAALFGGDFVCLDYRTDASHPSIVVWDHEASEERAPRFDHVCGSFREFLAGLKQLAM